MNKRARDIIYQTLELFRTTLIQQPQQRTVFSDWKDADDWLFSELDLTAGEVSQIYADHDTLVHTASCLADNTLVSDEERIEVPTKCGKLIAVNGLDCEYPCIHIRVTEPDGYERTLGIVECTPNHPAKKVSSLRLLVWNCDDDQGNYTNDFTFVEVTDDE